MYDLASRSVSILDNFLFFGSVGIKSLKVLNAELTLVLMMTAARQSGGVGSCREKRKRWTNDKVCQINHEVPSVSQDVSNREGKFIKSQFSLAFFLAFSTNDDGWLDYLCVRYRSLIFASRLDGDIFWIFFSFPTFNFRCLAWLASSWM